MRKRKSHTEKLLEEARKNPSRICHDERQVTLWDYLKQKGFADLDKAISNAMAQTKKEDE
jgi:hypothetical protein